jgi:citrate lyase subunit beta/citryl-CoA lyase
LTVLDSVFTNLDDAPGLEAECRQGADFGFHGKTLIHPSQIETCNRVFSPEPAEVEQARAVIAAFADPANTGRGALRVDGRMVERLHLGQAERLVAAAEAIAARGP